MTTGFASRLKQLRQAAGLTQTELGERAGLSHVPQLEQGRSEPTWPVALKLAEALGVDVGAFVPTKGARKPKPAGRGRPRKR